MNEDSDFLTRLEKKIRQQLAGQRVGYLLGAGSSYLDGKGYPLTSMLWDEIKKDIPSNKEGYTVKYKSGYSKQTRRGG